MDYIVAGPCEVAGVPPGGTVSQQVLQEASANIDALLVGGHLKPAPVPETPEVPKAKTTGKAAS